MPVGAIRVEGLNELRRAFRDASVYGVPNAVKTANLSAAQFVAQKAAPQAPRRTGRLAASVRALGSLTAGRVRAGNASVPYAAAIHWGRKVGNVGRPPGNRIAPNRIPGRPFIWDTVQQSQAEIADLYEQIVDRLVVAAINAVKGTGT